MIKVVLCLLLAYTTFGALMGFERTFFEAVKDPNNRWNFYNDAGYLGEMQFRPDGKIGIYDNPNERRWTFKSTNGFLHFWGDKNKLTCKFVNTWIDGFGKWHATGRFLLSDNGWTHYIVQK